MRQLITSRSNTGKIAFAEKVSLLLASRIGPRIKYQLKVMMVAIKTRPSRIKRREVFPEEVSRGNKIMPISKAGYLSMCNPTPQVGRPVMLCQS